MGVRPVQTDCGIASEPLTSQHVCIEGMFPISRMASRHGDDCLCLPVVAALLYDAEARPVFLAGRPGLPWPAGWLVTWRCEPVISDFSSGLQCFRPIVNLRCGGEPKNAIASASIRRSQNAPRHGASVASCEGSGRYALAAVRTANGRRFRGQIGLIARAGSGNARGFDPRLGRRGPQILERWQSYLELVAPAVFQRSAEKALLLAQWLGIPVRRHSLFRIAVCPAFVLCHGRGAVSRPGVPAE